MKAHDQKVLGNLDRTIARLELRAERQGTFVSGAAHHSTVERLRQQDILVEIRASLSRLRTYRNSLLNGRKAS
jgi:hypothetical protein